MAKAKETHLNSFRPRPFETQQTAKVKASATRRNPKTAERGASVLTPPPQAGGPLGPGPRLAHARPRMRDPSPRRPEPGTLAPFAPRTANQAAPLGQNEARLVLDFRPRDPGAARRRAVEARLDAAFAWCQRFDT